MWGMKSEQKQFSAKVSRSDGKVAQILAKTRIPRMVRLKQTFDTSHLVDIEQVVKSQLTRPGTLDRIRPGQVVAVTAGSRGVANIAQVIRFVIQEIMRVGGVPFVFPAMGSHGGAKAEGQLEIL